MNISGEFRFSGESGNVVSNHDWRVVMVNILFGCEGLRQPLRGLTLTLTLVAVLLPMAAVAKPANVTDGEIAMLPIYCPDTMGFNYGASKINMSPLAPKWLAQMGPGFWTMHHYCWGLVNWRRANSMPKQSMERRHTLVQVVNDYQFVVKNTTSNFLMLPEILTRMGEVYLELDDVGAAYQAFYRAREIKPDYWPAYSRWAAVLIKSGQKKEAMKLVRLGLEHAPDSDVLNELYRGLGGDPATIAPPSEKK